MKITTLQNDLVSAIQVASRFTSQRAQLPLLGNILIKAGTNKLQLAATNLETSVSLTIGAQSKNSGEITVPARVLNDFVAQIPNGKVELETKKDILHIKSGKFFSTIRGVSSEEFPEVPHTMLPKQFELPQKDLLSAFHKVLYAVSTDETRPILTGVLFIFEDEKLSLVATDGFRLSRKYLALNDSYNATVIVPRAVLSELARVNISEKLTCSLTNDNNQILFGVGNTIIASRIIQGDYPDYNRIIPESHSFSIKVDKDDFARAVKASGVFARDSSDALLVNLTKDTLELTSESKQTGNQRVVIDSKTEMTSSGKSLTIAFNYRFLSDYLSTVNSETVELQLTNGESPGVFLDPSDPDYLHLIMPVKL